MKLFLLIIGCLSFAAEWNDTTWQQYPFMARLEIEFPEFYAICGGSIIATHEYNGKGVILTAAHCVWGASNINVKIGCTKSDCTDDDVQTYNDDRSVMHPLYDGSMEWGNQEWSNHDVALIFLKQPITVHGAKTISLHPKIDVFTNDAPIRVLGYYGICGGDYAYGCVSPSDTDTLEYADINFMETAECSSTWGPYIAGPHDFCTKDDDPAPQTTCGGDSGSPLIYQNMQIGLVSWGSAYCDPDLPSVAASIPYYYEWIANQCAECVVNHYPASSSDDESWHQVVGAKYEVNYKCYIALTECIDCLNDPDLYPHDLTETDCVPQYHYPACTHSATSCLMDNGGCPFGIACVQVKDRIYEVNGICYIALDECYGCLNNPYLYPTHLQQTSCRSYNYPECAPNCLVNYGGCLDDIPCHQVIGRVYEVINGECYIALTGCMNCLLNPMFFPMDLQLVPCENYQSTHSFFGHELGNKLQFNGFDGINSYYGLTNFRLLFVVFIALFFITINCIICFWKNKNEYKIVSVDASDDEV